MWLEPALGLTVKLISICHFGDTTHNDLGGELKQIPRVSVQFMVQKLAKGLILPCLLADVVAGNIRYCQRFAQRIRLLWGRQEFDLRGQLHNQIVSCFQYLDKKGAGLKRLA